MTKREAIEKTRTLLEVLRDMPDDKSIDILSATVHYTDKIGVHLYSGLETVSSTFSVATGEIDEGDYTRRVISRDEIDIFQFFNKENHVEE